MQRSGFLKRRTPLAAKGKSDVALVKDEIQATARSVVILRDGGCILRNVHHRNFPECGGYTNAGNLILQADHLITRANAATFADTRLIVCVCKGHHGWKSVGSNLRKAQYDALVKTLISPERVKLWEACEADSWRPVRTSAYDWQLSLAALKQELRTYDKMTA